MAEKVELSMETEEEIRKSEKESQKTSKVLRRGFVLAVCGFVFVCVAGVLAMILVVGAYVDFSDRYSNYGETSCAFEECRMNETDVPLNFYVTCRARPGESTNYDNCLKNVGTYNKICKRTQCNITVVGTAV
jgi:hypothetical protein